ncbi:hypothetical protein VKT23_009918 [Stygiomarasmius scandens]
MGYKTFSKRHWPCCKQAYQRAVKKKDQIKPTAATAPLGQPTSPHKAWRKWIPMSKTYQPKSQVSSEYGLKETKLENIKNHQVLERPIYINKHWWEWIHTTVKLKSTLPLDEQAKPGGISYKLLQQWAQLPSRKVIEFVESIDVPNQLQLVHREKLLLRIHKILFCYMIHAAEEGSKITGLSNMIYSVGNVRWREVGEGTLKKYRQVATTLVAVVLRALTDNGITKAWLNLSPQVEQTFKPLIQAVNQDATELTDAELARILHHILVTVFQEEESIYNAQAEDHLMLFQQILVLMSLDPENGFSIANSITGKFSASSRCIQSVAIISTISGGFDKPYILPAIDKEKFPAQLTAGADDSIQLPETDNSAGKIDSGHNIVSCSITAAQNEEIICAEGDVEDNGKSGDASDSGKENDSYGEDSDGEDSDGEEYEDDELSEDEEEPNKEEEEAMHMMVQPVVQASNPNEEKGENKAVKKDAHKFGKYVLLDFCFA